MTLCIAATSLNFMDTCIVLCADSMVSRGDAHAHTEGKIRHLPHFVAMYSGGIAETEELISAYEKYLSLQKRRTELTVDEWLERLREPLRRHKSDMVNDFVRRTLCMTYQEFLDRGDQVEANTRQKVADHITYYLPITTEFLLAGFVAGTDPYERARIIRTRNEDVDSHKDFAAVGVGSEAAEQWLYRREQSWRMELPMTLYHVYEAKRLGEIAPEVGKPTTLAVMEPRPGQSGRVYRTRWVSRAGLNLLEEHYQRFGPQKVGTISIPEGLRFYN